MIATYIQMIIICPSRLIHNLVFILSSRDYKRKRGKASFYQKERMRAACARCIKNNKPYGIHRNTKKISYLFMYFRTTIFEHGAVKGSQIW